MLTSRWTTPTPSPICQQHTHRVYHTLHHILRTAQVKPTGRPYQYPVHMSAAGSLPTLRHLSRLLVWAARCDKWSQNTDVLLLKKSPNNPQLQKVQQNRQNCKIAKGDLVWQLKNGVRAQTSLSKMSFIMFFAKQDLMSLRDGPYLRKYHALFPNTVIICL